MPEEVIVKYTMRAPLIALCVFVCLISGAMIAFGWGTLDHQVPRQNPEAFIGLGVLGLVWAVWTVRSLASGKPYLETSEEGIFVGTGLHCYIPWENVGDISARQNEVRTRFGTTTVKVCSIDLKDPDNVYFDKFSHRMLRKYFGRGLPINLASDARTSWPSERLAAALRERWQREVDRTRESRA
ncbi:hypothetical protein [Pseudodesulfovibrio methanolicus]|uniref:PH domain-containing protein n=1 Tax=Pseudodesulfovibrio methanolicus TaxID=3126690 RepID=A0ABZ2IS79_9BACT